MRSTISFFLSSYILYVAAYDNTRTPACSALSSSLSQSVFYPDSVVYNASIFSYPFLQSRLNPACIVRPESAVDVATTIRILRNHSSTEFAVKGGGHNANAGFNNVDRGVTIDMQSMKSVDLEGNGNLVRVGAGALWQEVYDALEKHNASVLGGRIGVVGVAGFLTGGGISFFSAERGWACDYVQNFELVLANGTITNANATFNSDLFTSLKGGQSNFGIVTRFDLRTFPVSSLWGGRIVYAPEAEASLLSGLTKWKFGEFTGERAHDPNAAGWVTFNYNSSTGLFTPTTILWYTKPEARPGALGLLTDVQPKIVDGTTIGSVAAFARNGSMAVKATSRHTIWATTTFRITPTIIHRIHALWRTLIPQVCDKYAYASPFSDITFQSLPPPPRNSTLPNIMGFPPNSSPHKDLIFLQIVFHFKDLRANKELQNELENFVRLFEKLANEEGASTKWEYLNFAAAWQNPLGGYGNESLERMKAVATAYDPESVFQKQLSGGFKLF